jgi:hypothetical protein
MRPFRFEIDELSEFTVGRGALGGRGGGRPLEQPGRLRGPCSEGARLGEPRFVRRLCQGAGDHPYESAVVRVPVVPFMKRERDSQSTRKPFQVFNLGPAQAGYVEVHSGRATNRDCALCQQMRNAGCG